MKSSESYKIKFEHRPDYLYAYVEAEEDSLELSTAYWQEIAQECKKNNYGKVLVEEDIPKGGVSIFEMYQFVTGVIVKLINIHIAFVERHIEQMEANKFGELAATNRGVSVKLFDNSADAEKWLLSL